MALFGVIPWTLFVDACRLLSVCLFLITSLSLNWYSFLSIIALLGEWLARLEWSIPAYSLY